ncbi:hypothetical protein WJX73_008513 [Symbiochloris irregularis]|uniref:Uncharacterized protein n=1 Tax=Symbiochloris irregularis TaxID=706552 RepID=A0AAW1PH91_9CHLO
MREFYASICPRHITAHSLCHRQNSQLLRSAALPQRSRLSASKKSGTDIQTDDGDPTEAKVLLIAFGALLAVFLLPRLAVWSIMPLERMAVATMLSLEQQLASFAFFALRWVATALGVLFALALALVFISSKTGVNLEFWRTEQFWDFFNQALEEDLEEDKNRPQK